MFTHPKYIKTWKDGQNVLAIPEKCKNTVHLKNIRDFNHGDGIIEPVQSYFDGEYNLETLKSCTIYSIPF
jgi:hypothetical protein